MFNFHYFQMKINFPEHYVWQAKLMAPACLLNPVPAFISRK